MFRAQMSIPTLLPNMTYHEHSVGVPFTFISRDALTPGKPGPYYFMPRLHLDNFFATLGGVLFWGFPKHMARFTVTADRYSVANDNDQPITTVSWEAAGELSPDPPSTRNFEPVRQMLSQPIISQVPASLGPFFILSDFDKNWDVATVRPLATTMDVFVEYVPGFAGGRYPAEGRSPGNRRVRARFLRAARAVAPEPPLPAARRAPSCRQPTGSESSSARASISSGVPCPSVNQS